MSILKATVLSRVNKICKRSETDIDDILFEALLTISKRTGILTTQATGTTTAGQAYITKPSDLAGKLIHSVQLDSDDPLRPITWQQYLFNNRPGFCLHNGRIYLRPNPTGNESYTVDYSQKATSVADLSEFDDDAEETIVRLTAGKLYEKYERYSEAENQLILYNLALKGLSGDTPDDPVCQYNGMEM